MKLTIVPIVIGDFGTITKGLFKGQEDLEDGGRVRDCSNDSIAEYSQNPEMSPGDLLSLKLQRKTIS